MALPSWRSSSHWLCSFCASCCKVVNGTAPKIDLIISDVVMPGMDGYTLVRQLRERMPQVKVILMSGYAEDAFQDQIDKDETLHFLPKPFTLKTLVGKVKEIIVSEGL